MESTEIYTSLTAIFREVFRDPGMIARPELTKDDIEEWDSLNHLRLILAIENAFQIHFSALEIFNLRKIGDFAALIQSKLSERTPHDPARSAFFSIPEEGRGIP